MKRSRASFSPRKKPVQRRSTQLVDDILVAAVRVLEKEGADRFTTIRVAEAAGVSVGSLYQYFPNKQAILYRLQVDEWARTGDMMDAIVGDRTKPAAERLRVMMRAFFRSEREEAPLRRALGAAAPKWRDAPESAKTRDRNRWVLRDFVKALAPRASLAQLRMAAELLVAVTSAVGKQASERATSERELDRWGDAVTDMLLAYLRGLGGKQRRAGPGRSRIES